MHDASLTSAFSFARGGRPSCITIGLKHCSITRSRSIGEEVKLRRHFDIRCITYQQYAIGSSQQTMQEMYSCDEILTWQSGFRLQSLSERREERIVSRQEGDLEPLYTFCCVKTAGTAKRESAASLAAEEKQYQREPSTVIAFQTVAESCR